ncbi:MAG: hypothetical protein JWN93_594 [Hyphomicrobiales bacterium]|nr:hypothetical protein [Hyphomicrobiales bacterium]
MIIRSAAIAAALFAAAPLTTAQAGPSYDGKWSVQIITEKGWCDVYRYNIGVAGGRITEVGAPGATANGRIDQGGRVNVQLAKGADVISVTGAVTGASGGGAWTLPNRSCAGRWRAEKLA